MIFKYFEYLVTYLLGKFVIVTIEVIILDDYSPSAILVSSVDSTSHVVLLCSVQDDLSGGEHGWDVIESSWTLYESTVSESSDGYRAYFAYAYR